MKIQVSALDESLVFLNLNFNSESFQKCFKSRAPVLKKLEISDSQVNLKILTWGPWLESHSRVFRIEIWNVSVSWFTKGSSLKFFEISDFNLKSIFF